MKKALRKSLLKYQLHQDADLFERAVIIVTATLSFETEADRDNAVALTAPVQQATRDDEAGCLARGFGGDLFQPGRVSVHALDQIVQDAFNIADLGKLRLGAAKLLSHVVNLAL